MRRLGPIRLWRGWAVDLGTATVIGVFLGVVGPFGSYLNGPVSVRVAYWLASVWTGTLVFGTASRFILGRRWSLPITWTAILASVVFLSAPFAGLVNLAAPAVWPTLTGFTFWDWYRQVLVITTPLALGYALLDRARETKADPPPIAPVDGLLGAAPSEVVCLQMEDHYVRVHTVGGSRLVLTTLAQAIAALNGARGLQTHRSWWIAEDAVRAVRAEGRNIRLELSTGLLAPVARSSVAAVREAGWLDRQHRDRDG